MPRWLLSIAAIAVFAVFFAGASAVQLGLSGVSSQVWTLAALAVAITALLGLVPKLAPIETRFGPFLCYASGLLLAFLYSNDLSKASEVVQKLLHLGLALIWAVLAVSSLTVLVPVLRKASALHAWLAAAFALGWTVSYFSGEAGGGASWVEALVRRFGWDLHTAELAVVAVRKTLHFTFYGTVALVGWALANAGSANRSSAAVVGLGMALAYALFDEGRQLSAANRTGSGWDVLLDTAGAVCFVWIAAGLARGRNASSRGVQRI